ncbi:unnamed protein product [Clonostachys rosea]|uniref:Uncharacterized protein n=1 Tax=Bionectria ochroleuca TaxID=29856 RepID=A0ABY6TTK7_BIOOC|nr:unnamed protein product [Clonostachys rosea]
MYSLNGGISPGFLPMEPQDAFLDTWATQQAVSEASRRRSRSSVQYSGSSMRVVKPTSANNSPRRPAASSRRPMMVNDNQLYKRPQHVPEQLPISRPANPRASRPVSWHPSSQFYVIPNYQLPQQYYPLTTTRLFPDQQDASTGCPQLSPMMTSYSPNTSPSSGFSPLPVEYPGTVPQYLNPNGWDTINTNNNGSYFPIYTELPANETPVAESTEWQPYTHGLSNTTPPTPDSTMYAQQPQPAVSEDPVRYDTLEEPEEEGEILVGMGLYDAPEKYDEDPQLNNYRSTTSSLFSSTYRSNEPTGKGLKLEETWEPPNSDEEEEDDEEEEEDEDASE